MKKLWIKHPITKLLSILFVTVITIVSFQSCDKDTTPPRNTQLDISVELESVTYNSAIVEITFSQVPNYSDFMYGLCISTEPDPTTEDMISMYDTITETTTVEEIYGLNLNTKYYARAYYIYREKTTYSDQIEFSTLSGTSTATTIEVFEIASTTAKVKANVNAPASFPITKRGVCWSTTTNPTLNNSFTNDGTGNGEFISTVTNLNVEVTYFVRAYAINAQDTTYGNELQFTTVTDPVLISTLDVTGITANSANCGGIISADGGSTISTRGVCWSTESNPTIANSFSQDGSGLGSYTSFINELTANTTYYVKAYAINGNGVFYGDEKTFTTTQQGATITSFVQNFSSLTDGDSPANLEGWSIYNEIGSTSWVAKEFAEDVYLSRHNYETGESELKTWVITPELDLSSGDRAIAFRSTSAYYNHSSLNPLTVVISTNYDGTNPLSASWTQLYPRLAYDYHGFYNWVGSGKVNLSSYSGNAYIAFIYHGDSYETTTMGIDDIVFDSYSNVTCLAYPETYYVTDITSNSALSGGYIDDDGGSYISQRGVCWDIETRPTINNSYTTDGSGTGSFSSTISGLSANTTYYVRSYAINNAGVSYGNEYTFTTESGGGGEEVIIMPPNFETSTPNLYTTSEGGYMAGPNGYGDLAKAQKYYFESGTSVLGSQIWFGINTITSGNLYLRIWNSSFDVIASKTISFSELEVSETAFLHSIYFDSPVYISGEFYIGLEWDEGITDGFGIISNTDGEGNGLNLAWEKWSDGTWYSFSDSWSVDVDLGIFTIIESNASQSKQTSNMNTKKVKKSKIKYSK